jgi:hypothetical protein
MTRLPNQYLKQMNPDEQPPLAMLSFAQHDNEEPSEE